MSENAVEGEVKIELVAPISVRTISSEGEIGVVDMLSDGSNLWPPLHEASRGLLEITANGGISVRYRSRV